MLTLTLLPSFIKGSWRAYCLYTRLSSRYQGLSSELQRSRSQPSWGWHSVTLEGNQAQEVLQSLLSLGKAEKLSCPPCKVEGPTPGVPGRCSFPHTVRSGVSHSRMPVKFTVCEERDVHAVSERTCCQRPAELFILLGVKRLRACPLHETPFPHPWPRFPPSPPVDEHILFKQLIHSHKCLEY